MSNRASLVAQRLKCLPPMRETQVRSLGQEDPMEKEMITHSSTLAWRIPWTEEPGRLQSTGSQRVGHDWATSLTHSLTCQISYRIQLFSCSVVSDSLWPHGLQNARLPCPSPSPGACWNSRPLSRWCHPSISSSVVLFSFCLQPFPVSGLIQWVSSLHQVTKVLELQTQHQSLQWILRIDFL